VFIKQQRMLMEENESWYHVSERIAVQFGIPRWSLSKLKPIDGKITNLEGDDDAYSFRWAQGQQ
jgi:hypothetical protein